jgi:hypothetical protein
VKFSGLPPESILEHPARLSSQQDDIQKGIIDGCAESMIGKRLAKRALGAFSKKIVLEQTVSAQ